ncbi:hypothetical protein BCR35DRAFT_305623 [Leucosporidium creatinivorum]|uniref:Uncharacterized protein n=1 Tax=Leucosporidium creatinivorum TaxID=106004 RepID=A0A1Y2F046_9BASI|nr:hypothetical protein BCR35DRAFT_305623 [Leucosporidium creatinivorum]
MASYYGRRASYVASWAPQRIYPRQEPSFDSPTASPPTLTRSRSPPSASTAAAAASPIAPGAADARPSQPPPVYYPGEAELARTRALEAGLPPGVTHSTNVASSRTAKVDWLHHPTLRYGWRRFVRIDLWWASLVRPQNEMLDEEWPEAFGGRRRVQGGDEEAEGGANGARVSRSMSRRSGVSAADSGVALTPRGTMEVQHPLEGLFKSRIEELNELVGGHLKRSRVWLSLMEIINFGWLLALIVVLGVEQGKQTGILKGVEVSSAPPNARSLTLLSKQVALVVVILINGIGFNAVRMRRWALARDLRARSRDWSPLPITTSTNAALLDNAGLNAGQHFFGQPDQEALAARVRGKDQPTLRWRMRGTEGSWWLSYRPVIKCELVTPSSSGLIAYPPPQAESIELDDEGHEHAGPPPGLAPAYTE